jgi:rhomboid protease GluP
VDGTKNHIHVNASNLESREGFSLKLVELMHGSVTLTPATIALVGINLAVFGAMLINGAGLWHLPNGIQVQWGAGFGPATKDGEWWRLGTAMFLHFGLVHLTVNMWALWDAGRLTERLYGSLRLFIIFIVSGLTGNLVSLIAQGDQAVSGGASGAIFGVYGALMVCLWTVRHRVHPVEYRWLFGGAVVFSLATLLFGLLIPGIDNAAHIGGLFSGALTGSVLISPLTNRDALTGRVRGAAAGVYSVLVIALVASIPAPSYRWHEELTAREGIHRFLVDDKRIASRWQNILDAGKQNGTTFEQLAGQIDSDIKQEYLDSFEQLSALRLDPAAPSASTLDYLKKYTLLRSDAAQSLSEALRKNDPGRMREAIDLARRAPDIARSAQQPASKLDERQ